MVQWKFFAKLKHNLHDTEIKIKNKNKKALIKSHTNKNLESFICESKIKSGKLTPEIRFLGVTFSRATIRSARVRERERELV